MLPFPICAYSVGFSFLIDLLHWIRDAEKAGTILLIDLSNLCKKWYTLDKRFMNKILNFKVIITQDDDGVFVATCPAIPGCHTQGATYEKAIENIEEAIKLCLKVAKDDSVYRDSIDFEQDKTPRFVGVSEISVPQPSFV